jgi:hypothetical protein
MSKLRGKQKYGVMLDDASFEVVPVSKSVVIENTLKVHGCITGRLQCDAPNESNEPQEDK